jgi:hypothetical protein
MQWATALPDKKMQILNDAQKRKQQRVSRLTMPIKFGK